jgi:hypothetical protein
VYLDITSGTAVDGEYTVTVTGVNTFTVTQASRTTSGNVTLRQNTIRASGNVSSISDNGTGSYTVNFTNAMPDTNYSVASNAFTDSSGVGGGACPTSVSTTSVSITSMGHGGTTNAIQDKTYVFVAIFR